MRIKHPKLWPFSGGRNEVARLKAVNTKINKRESDILALTDLALRNKTDEYRKRLAAGEGLDDLLVEAYAVVREAARRSAIHQRPRDVQVLAGIALHNGRMVEMQNGEGKTLAATMPLYLHALAGWGAHLITANDYLAQRDAQWMGPIYHALGISVGVVIHEAAFRYDPTVESTDLRFKRLRPVTRREAYVCDIVYGAIDEMVFDYLRDNMVWDLTQSVHRQFAYALVDEADLVMLDLAGSPYQLSGPSQQVNVELCRKLADLVRIISTDEITIENGSVEPSEFAVALLQERLGVSNLYDASNSEIYSYLDAALRAQFLYRRDDDYIVSDGRIVVIDQVRRRPLPGRQFGGGLQAAIEIKEGILPHQNDSQIYAQITVGSYLRLYSHLSGMTGSACAAEDEFIDVYGLTVIPIPTHLPSVRYDYPDAILKSRQSKMRAVMREIKEMNEHRRPVLVGTRTEDDSNLISDMLVREGIEHVVLNGKYHARESEIIAQAGQIGRITISTRMAGRGTDIVLGPGVKELGGLHVIATEHQESRRLDAQLRGRAGRQGDPGSSHFFVSLDDPLMQRFGGERIKGIMEWAKIEDDAPLQHALLTKSISQSQLRAEGYDLDTRMRVLEFDEILEKQRAVIYAQRRQVLSENKLEPLIMKMIHETLEDILSGSIRKQTDDIFSTQELQVLIDQLKNVIPLPAKLGPDDWGNYTVEKIREVVCGYIVLAYQHKTQEMKDLMPQAERITLLRAVDNHWISYLDAMDDLKRSLALRSLARHDSLAVFAKEAAAIYDALIVSIRQQVARDIFRVQLANPVKPIALPIFKKEYSDPVSFGSGMQEPADMAVEKVIGNFGEGIVKDQGVHFSPEFILKWAMQWPVEGKIIQGFAEHQALEIELDSPSIVQAPTAGCVTAIHRGKDRNFTLRIEHGEGLVTIFARLAAASVPLQQMISAGESVGACDEILHFSVQYKDTPVDPLIFLQAMSDEK